MTDLDVVTIGAGGVIGSMYIGSGPYVNCVTFGRIAGRNAAAGASDVPST